MKTHNYIQTYIESGERIKAIAPVIISASRSTDIPAFFSPWFFDTLDKGYCVWKNPYNGKNSYVSFANTRFIVFWSKNPAPLVPYLPELKERGLGFYIQFSLNDYESEGFEPHVPKLTHRIDIFKHIVDTYGLDSVVWRFDPLMLSDEIGVEELLEKIHRIGMDLSGYTEKLVFSFADIMGYKKVSTNLKRAGVNYREWAEDEMLELAVGLKNLNLPMRLSTCAEAIELSNYGIEHNKCIDAELISRLAPGDPVLQMWLFGASKDMGQRKACGCILSKDIGHYNTCTHGCLYCYATHTPTPLKNAIN